MNTTELVIEKNLARTGFEPLTSALPWALY